MSNPNKEPGSNVISEMVLQFIRITKKVTTNLNCVLVLCGGLTKIGLIPLAHVMVALYNKLPVASKGL